MSALIHDVADAFSAEECDAIVALRDPRLVEPGHVWRGHGYAVDPAVRLVSTCYRPRNAETSWLYTRLDALFGKAATALGASVAPIAEPVQVMRYDVGGHYQIWHSDAGANSAERRVSVSVELSDGEDYAGGDLQILPDAMQGRAGLPRGAARFFLSRALHRVTPVTRGVRHALVIWAPPLI